MNDHLNAGGSGDRRGVRETTHDDNEVEGADEESNNGKICAAQVASWASDNG